MIARRIGVAFLCLVIGPAALFAQRGIGGFGRGRGPGSLQRDPGVVIPAQVNMVNLLLVRRQEVALTDSQWVRILAVKRTLDSANAPLLRRLDSVARLFRKGAPLFAEPTAARRDSLNEARAVVRETALVVGENNSAAREQVYALLDQQQLIKARAIEDIENKRKP